MTDRTRIEWADATWNPLIGCSRVSPGCDRCYAVNQVHRGLCDQHRGLTIRRPGQPADWTGEVRLWEPALDQPLRWRRARRIFVCSLSDLFHPSVPDGTIARIFAVMALAPQHTFQVLTKRPQRMADLLSGRAPSGPFWRQVRDAMTDVASTEEILERAGLIRLPLPNVWLGTSIESDGYAFRAAHLRYTPAAVRWISAEPLLGPLPSLDLTGIDWIVVGGETGHGSRPMHPDWVRVLRDRCTALDECTDLEVRTLNGITPGLGDQLAPHRPAFFFKQWGDWAPNDDGRARRGEFHGGGDFVECCRCVEGDDPPMYRVGKKAAGRELDGRTWDEYPEVPGA